MSEDRQRYTSANREAWDEAAPVHRRLNQAKLIEGFAEPGYNTLDEHCLECLESIGVTDKTVAAD